MDTRLFETRCECLMQQQTQYRLSIANNLDFAFDNGPMWVKIIDKK